MMRSDVGKCLVTFCFMGFTLSDKLLFFLDDVFVKTR